MVHQNNLSLSYSTLKDCITCSRLFLSFLHFRVSISRQMFTKICAMCLTFFLRFRLLFDACLRVCAGVCVRVLTLLTIASSAFFVCSD